MSPFTSSSYLSQVRRLRTLALSALTHYPIKLKKLEFIKYSANAIFRVTDSRNKRFQLRISPPEGHLKPAALEEIKWLNHIKKHTNLLVPTPIASRTGQYMLKCYHPKIDSYRFSSLFEWLEGKTKWRSINTEYAYQLGTLIGQLQKDARNLKFKHRLYWDAEGLVGTGKARFWNVEKLSNVSKKQQALITEARRLVYRKLRQYEKSNPRKSGMIHGDIQPNNILVHKDQYAVIDFDECGVGLYGDDLSTALFAFEYVTETCANKNFQKLENALYEGYAAFMPFEQEDIEMMPYFLLSRKLVGIAWLERRKHNPLLKKYYQRAVKRAISFYRNKMKAV